MHGCKAYAFRRKSFNYAGVGGLQRINGHKQRGGHIGCLHEFFGTRMAVKIHQFARYPLWEPVEAREGRHVGLGVTIGEIGTPR